MTAARLRRASLDDLPGIVAVKEALRISRGDAGARGGFLLGCSAERYAFLIDAGNLLVLESDRRLAGFAASLPDALLRASDLWARRHAIRWDEGEGEPPEGARIAYFDQLALAPWAPRQHAAPLAIATLRGLAESGHDHLYATTIEAPVRNSASMPLLRAFGARPVGLVEEEVEGIGPIVSRLHHADMEAGMAKVIETAAGARAFAAASRLAAEATPQRQADFSFA